MPRLSNKLSEFQTSCSCAAQCKATIDVLAGQLEIARRTIYELSLQMSSFNAGYLLRQYRQSAFEG